MGISDPNAGDPETTQLKPGCRLSIELGNAVLIHPDVRDPWIGVYLRVFDVDDQTLLRVEDVMTAAHHTVAASRALIFELDEMPVVQHDLHVLLHPDRESVELFLYHDVDFASISKKHITVYS